MPGEMPGELFVVYAKNSAQQFADVRRVGLPFELVLALLREPSAAGDRSPFLNCAADQLSDMLLPVMLGRRSGCETLLLRHLIIARWCGGSDGSSGRCRHSAADRVELVDILTRREEMPCPAAA